jgi:hypothetical protein
MICVSGYEAIENELLNQPSGKIMIAQRPIVLCGLGELGILTLERLLAFGERVVVVDPDPPEAFAMHCHSATVGRRYVRPVFLESHSQNWTAPFELMEMAGQPWWP